MTVIETDVLIVGAGAAGTVMATVLAEAGKRVHVVDAGPEWTIADLVSSQIWSRRLRWGGPAVPTAGAQPVGVGFNAGWGFGGAALHHYATWPRLKPEDFAMRSRFGEGLDWPFGYETLRPYYDRVQAEVGISGDAIAEVWRPAGADYPMPPLAQTRQADAIRRGFDKLGLRVAPAPMAINSVDHNNRPACLLDGWCDAGCPIGALANPLIVYKPRAEAAGAVFEALTPAIEVVVSRDGCVDGVRVGGPEPRIIRARVVILAASVAHNPALLLGSTSARHPGGIGNRSGQVGRYVMTHPAVAAFGLFDDIDTEPHRGVTGAQLIAHDNYVKDAVPGSVGGWQWLVAPSIKPNDLAGIAIARADLIGPALDAFMRRAARHIGNMIGMAEALPDADNRVTLLAGATATEPARPQLTHRHRPGAQRAWERMQEQGLAIMRAAGAAEAWTGQQFSAHLMGGTVMGNDPATSVADGFGRVHDMANLYVAGPGLFPTGGAVNPTFTVHALARRSAEHIVAHWPAA